MISPKDLELLEQALPQMSETERQRNLKLLLDYKKELIKEAGGKTFLEFIKHVYPDYKVGAHHAKLAKLFEEIGNPDDLDYEEYKIDLGKRLKENKERILLDFKNRKIETLKTQKLDLENLPFRILGDQDI